MRLPAEEIEAIAQKNDWNIAGEPRKQMVPDVPWWADEELASGKSEVRRLTMSPPVKPTKMILPTPTLAEVVAHNRPLDRATAKKWGLKFPLKAGWKDRLIRELTEKADQEADAYRRNLSPRSAARLDALRAKVAEAEDLVAQAQAHLNIANAEFAAFIRGAK